MATLLFKLRQVTDEEAMEVRQLLDESDISYYETSAGLFGIGLPAIWLAEDSQLSRARALLDEYQRVRAERVAAEYANLRREGQQETFARKLRREPLRIILYCLAILAVLAISLWPFLTL